MMTDKNADQIKVLYTELAKSAPSQDWEKLLKIAKKILGLSVNEKKAFQTKIVCLINLEKFDEALTSIERFNDGNEFPFEKAYCAYRLNKTEEAYSILKNCNELGVKEKELLAQVAYRLEKYQESYDCYRDIVKNINDEFDAERQTNLSGVVAALRASGVNKDLDMSESEKKTFELCYNSACISISKENYVEALEKLKKAEIMCKKTFEDDLENPDDQEAFDREIAIIKAQYSYCLQKLGKFEESMKTYNNVLKTKRADAGVVAIISNNMICINKDQNVFDSKKRIKVAASQEVENKLNSLQKRVISYNEILFSIYNNQNDAAQKLLKQFELKFNDKERLTLLKMAQLYKEKKYNEAEKILMNLKNESSPSVSFNFYLLQILLFQGKIEEAITVFKELDAFKSFKLGIVSSVITLLNGKQKNEEIAKLFESAINYFKQNNLNSKEFEIYVRENSNFQINRNNLIYSCELLEKLRQLRPTDYRVLSKLINLYSKFDAEKAKNLSKELPSLEDIIADSKVDIENLESQFSSLSFKYSKTKTAAGSLKSPTNNKSNNQTIQKTKSKKKKKIKLPKNYDPSAPIDQERWLPLRERSYYKGRRNKKKGGVGKGTQGSVSTKETTQPQSPKAAETPQLPDKTKSRPLGTHQKKKKKGGSKW